MNNRQQRLLLEQADRKLAPYKELISASIPQQGWINTIRVALNMSLRQLGKKLGRSPQAVKGLETSEKNGTITIQSLHELGKAMDLKLVYGFVPLEGSLEELINKKAEDMARQIVNRVSGSMKLEDQQIQPERLKRAIADKTYELKTQIPKHLWE
jgi:predicted DNA-binding mobile mystery protein A